METCEGQPSFGTGRGDQQNPLTQRQHVGRPSLIDHPHQTHHGLQVTNGRDRPRQGPVVLPGMAMVARRG
jgi:hypothetical protein